MRTITISAILVIASTAALSQAFDDRAFLQRASDRVSEYHEVFHDLTAEETAKFRFVDVTGRVSATRTIVSSLIIYRSQADSKLFVEYRDVESVDGKSVKDHEKRAIRLLEGVADARSAADELERITREGSRYNKDVVTVNLTLHEAVPLMMRCRHAFTFAYIGDEVIRTIPTRAYFYEQVQPCDASHYDLHLPKDYESGHKWHDGVLWLEAATARVVRERRRVFAEDAREPKLRAKVIDAMFDYNPSTFGILVPANIDITSYHVTNRTTQDGPVTVPRTYVTQAYGPFSKFDVTVQQHVVYPDTDPIQP